MSIVPHVLRDRLAVVTDEVDLDVEVAAGRLRDWGVVSADIRAVGDQRVPLVDESTVFGLARALTGISVGALSPGIFKGALRGAEFEHERDVVLPAALRMAGQFGARQVIVFGGRSGERMDDVVPVLAAAKALASEHAIELLVENSSLCRVAIGEDLLRVVEDIGIGVVWDPANAIAAGAVDLLASSRALAHIAASVHVRDWSPVRGWCRLQEGRIPWSDLIASLESEGFAGRYVVESHLPDDGGASEWNLRVLVEALSGRA